MPYSVCHPNYQIGVILRKIVISKNKKQNQKSDIVPTVLGYGGRRSGTISVCVTLMRQLAIKK